MDVGACEKSLIVFKASRGAARADSAARPSLPLRPGQTTRVGWHAESTRGGAALPGEGHEAAAI